MTKAQEVYEQVEAMMASGEVKKAGAFKTLAEQYGQPVDSLRGAYYQHKRVLDSGGNPSTSGGGTRRTRRRETTSETAVESAIATLRRAVENIDAEIAVAKERATEAQAEYEAMQASADERRAAIEEKITLLEQSA
jgi:Asp-tRNA(Asn)/Glu-tRNA(Gln) amidotransferase A subunit family amidase